VFAKSRFKGFSGVRGRASRPRGRARLQKDQQHARGTRDSANGFDAQVTANRRKQMSNGAQLAHAADFGKEEKRVIFASSLGTVFEWYDFYLYAVLAPFFAALFFPPGNNTAALLSAFATYAAGFLVRPFGAIIFGRIGDLVGRKYTFLVTIMVMGTSTFLV